jgi:hypothetical protein
MLFAIILLTVIILASSFGLHIMSIDSLYNLPDKVASHALYVCPVTSGVFDSIAIGLRPYTLYINMFFFFAVMLLFFAWGWGLYQNLLKDSFKKDTFKNPWVFTKMIFWVAVIMTILVWTPNHYRNIHLKGANGNWVLCEENSPGAKAVLSDAVKR